MVDPVGQCDGCVVLSLKAYPTFDQAVISYLVFCFFVISSTELLFIFKKGCFLHALPHLSHVFDSPHLCLCCGCSNFGSIAPMAVLACCRFWGQGIIPGLSSAVTENENLVPLQLHIKMISF